MRDADEDADPLGWWNIAGSELLELLRRAHDGEDPDVIYAEAYANSGITDYGASGEGG